MTIAAMCEGVQIDPTRYPSSIGAYLNALIRTWPEGELVEVSLEGPVKRVSFVTLWEQALVVLTDLRERWPKPVPVRPSAHTLADRVAISWACLMGGYPLVVAPLDWSESDLPPGTRAYSVDLSRGQPFTPASATESVPSVKLAYGKSEATAPEQILAYVLTSGTTGQPRFACITEQALRYQYCTSSPIRVESNNSNQTLDKPNEAHLSLFPWHSVAGMRRALFPRAHRQFFLEPEVLLAHPLQILDLMERERVNGISLSTSFATVLLDLLESNSKHWDLSALKHISLGAEPIMPAVFQKLVQRLADQCQAEPQVVPGYGMTETGVLCSAPDDPGFLSRWLKEDPPVSVGQPTEGWRIRVVDDTDQLLSEGEEGHLQVHSREKGFAGYLGEPTNQSATHTADGWFRTGDLGWIREGWVWVCGRAKETLIINGAKYPPQSIERSLADVPGVLQGQIYACRVRAADAVTDALGIFFVPDPAHSAETTQHVIRARVARDLHLSVLHVQPIAAENLPRTATGKLQRNALGASALLPKEHLRQTAEHVDYVATSTPLEHALAALWQEVLMLATPPGIHDNFFALGGHSLLSASLISRIDAQFRQQIPLHTFFQTPTIAGLAAILREAKAETLTSNTAHRPRTHPEPSKPQFKPQETPEQRPAAATAPVNSETDSPATRRLLDPALYRCLLSYLGSWQGERASPDSLIVGQHLGGTRPPLFWVFQGQNEMLQLAISLGSDQPLYGLRSGHLVMDYTEDNIQAIALDYVREIEQLRPDGPLVIGGNCQGAVIGLAIAQHLLRRRRHVPLLILMEWSFQTQPYAGPVALIFGRESEAANPYWYFRHPERMWQRSWPHHQIEMIPGAHGQFFTQTNVQALAATVRRLIDASFDKPLCFLPAGTLCAELAVTDPPQRMQPGEQRLVQLRVTNRSTLDWPDGKAFGLTLVNQWLDTESKLLVRLDGSTSLPALSAGATTEVTLALCAPQQPAAYQLALRIIEEGVRHRKTDQSVLHLPVQVEAVNEHTDEATGGSE